MYPCVCDILWQRCLVDKNCQDINDAVFILLAKKKKKQTKRLSWTVTFTIRTDYSSIDEFHSMLAITRNWSINYTLDDINNSSIYVMNSLKPNLSRIINGKIGTETRLSAGATNVPFHDCRAAHEEWTWYSLYSPQTFVQLQTILLILYCIRSVANEF